MSMKMIYITGIPGTGKSTITQRLQEAGYNAHDLEAIPNLCYWTDLDGNPVPFPSEVTQEFQQNHNWFCDIEHFFSKQTGNLLILSGPPMQQGGFYKLFDKVLLLRCPKEVFIERLIKRDNNSYGKNEELRNNILTWYENFETKMLESGATPVDVDRDIEGIVEDIKTIITI